MIYLSDDLIEYVEEADGLMLHFSYDDRPTVLEIQEASDWLARLTKITATAQPDQALPV
jgi:hypothetical protein